VGIRVATRDSPDVPPEKKIAFILKIIVILFCSVRNYAYLCIEIKTMEL
jgi:hypothetical protein